MYRKMSRPLKKYEDDGKRIIHPTPGIEPRSEVFLWLGSYSFRTVYADLRVKIGWFRTTFRGLPNGIWPT
jgi:hypothetical protein